MATTESQGRLAFETFATTWRRVVTDPAGFFADMPETGGLGAPTACLAICAAANAAGHLLVGAGVVGMVWIFVAQVVGAYVAAALLVLISQNLFGGRAGFEPMFRVVAYAAAPRVFAWVPVLGVVAWVYGAYLTLRGLERVQGLDTTRAVLALVLAFGILWLLAAVRTGMILP